MAAFVEEVLAIARKSTIPREEVWTAGGLGGTNRSGTFFLGEGGEKHGVIPRAGMEGELGTELLKRFPTGTVSWQGVVESAVTDVEKGVHVILVAFPPHQGSVKVRPVFLTIPFATMPRDRSPAVGEQFAFTGKLGGEKDDPIFRDSVQVAYYFAGKNRGDQAVFVSLVDVAPVTKTK